MAESVGSLNREFKIRADNVGLTTQVLGDGDFYAEAAIVAEFPGPREVDIGLPLVGRTGSLLWNTLKKHDIGRREVYITNVCKRKLTTGEDEESRVKITRNEWGHWYNMLRWELAQLPNLRYIFVLGDAALEALVGERQITKWRGSLLETELPPLKGIEPRKVQTFVTYNPAYALREPRLEVVLAKDLAKGVRFMREGYKPYDIKAHINPSPSEVIAWIDKMHDEKRVTSLDIETDGHETLCVGLANDNHEGMCINFRDAHQDRFSIGEERDIRKAIARFVDDPGVKLIMQNGMFDAAWLYYKDRIRVRRVWFDTMLAHHAIYPRLPHGLGFICTQYTDHPYYKDEKDDWKVVGDIDRYWVYNVKDCCITRKSGSVMMAELKQFGLEDLFFNHIMRLHPWLVNKMTINGVLVDVNLKKSIYVQLERDLQELRTGFIHLAREASGIPDLDINPLSRTDLQDLFFRKCKLVGRGTSTNKANRERIRQHPRTTESSRRMLVSLDEYKKQQKFFSTYVVSRIDEDGRFRSEYKQTGTQSAPGRLSSAQVWWGTGGNMQNQPQRAHAMFIAPTGYRFLYFDLKQAEAVVVAHLSGCKALIDNFAKARNDEGFDVHRANAARIFKKPYDTIPRRDWDDNKEPTLRYIGKRCVHGLNYRMMPDKLAEVCKISLSQATEAWHSYHNAFPEIRKWWQRTIDQVKHEHALVTPYGRRFVLMERLEGNDAALESIIAFVPQSTIGDKNNEVTYLAQEHQDWPSDHAYIAINVHDSLTSLVAEGYEAQCARILRDAAEKPINIAGMPVSIGSDFKISVPMCHFYRHDIEPVHRWSSLVSYNVPQ